MPVNVRELILNLEVKGKQNNNATPPKVVAGGGGLGKFDKEIIIREAVRRAMEEMEYRLGR
jgi:hypothetical protein